ncbi:hypothetical protein SAMN03159338_1535 [Sphingomonas sp. NFR04]|jgi:hypothetical protein|uniref:hypothetical protein n=1 Tax=Sphingomonas sp. NFR04 TaxID=1566283 RepID=UPI0008E66E16|nr:hypothetical protein [Sphingomonas sp. NFR04]SFJ48813.1 hypothetical protein SAMN03159338_1535 [Sphingomonas sp. NFR04]
MLYYLWGLIFGEIVRDYGRGFKVRTFVGESGLRCLTPTGVVPVASNDNLAGAA